MALANLAQKNVLTRHGTIQLWIAPEAPGAQKPIVLAIPGIFAPLEDIAALSDSLGILGTLCVMRLPSTTETALSPGSLVALSEAVSEIVETTFAGRHVVLFGVSVGAVAALGVRASNLARIVAVEPPLATGELWPVIEPLRRHLQQLGDAGAEAFAFEAFGIDGARLVGRDHLGVTDGLDVPVDLVLGEEPLRPQRQVGRFPSLVEPDARQRLIVRSGVAVHVVRKSGHNVLGQSPAAVRAILLEACRRASVGIAPERRGLDEPLLEATPLAVGEVLHWGPGGAAFEVALGQASPHTRVTTLGAASRIGQDGPAQTAFDAVVLGARPSAELMAEMVSRLKPGGDLIARGLGPAPDLASLGLALRPAPSPGSGIVRALKPVAGEGPAPALHLKTVVYSGLLMDIRTRLPARGLRSDPDLEVVFEIAPFELPRLGRDVPKVVVLQRPAELKAEAWRPFMANAIRDGWIVVMEYDDYPPLVAEVQGRASSEADLLRFGFVHAVQTASPPLQGLFQPYNPEVALFANAVFDLAPFPQGDRPRRVFYGAVIRGRYAVAVARSLAPAIAQAPDTEFIVVGDAEVFAALPTQAKRYYDYMSYEAYLDLMSQCTISLSPIEALPMRETKSDAKFLDASRAGVLTIASPTIYDRVIDHGVNGFLARQVADWAPLLGRALTDEPLRSRLARRAWEYVRQERMFADQVALRRDWYRDLWRRRAELNAAVMQRLPGLREAVEA